MLRKISSVYFVTMLLVSIALGYSGGAGTSSEPYLIGSPGDIVELSSTGADWGKYFKLTGNINLSGYPNLKIGTGSSTPFSGQFDGDGFTISNYTFTNSEDYGALFGYISATAVVKNVKMTGVNISVGSGKYAAGLVGNNYGTVEQ